MTTQVREPRGRSGEVAPAEGTPRTATEDLVAALWARVLRIEPIDLDTSFFDLAGHSLLAMQLLVRVREACGLELTLQELVEAPTVRSLARIIDSRATGAASRPQRADAREPRGEPLPLSLNQEGWLFLEGLAARRGASRSAYHLVRAVRFTRPLDVAALERALNDVVRRHQSLRAAIVAPSAGGEVGIFGQPRPYQVIVPEVQVPLRVVPLHGTTEDERREEVLRLWSAEALRPFDYEQPPLLRAVLARLDASDHILIVVIHHIICDRWSFRLFMRELALRYRPGAAERPPLPEPRIRYVDFAAWQRMYLASARAQEDVTYWLARWEQLAQARLVTPDLPFAAAAGTPREAFKATETLVLGPALTAALRRVVRDRKLTPYMILRTAFELVLRAYTGRPRVAIVSHFANRTLPGLEEVVGWFAQPHAIAVEGEPDQPVSSLLDQARRAQLEAHARQHVPEALLWAVVLRNPRRARGVSPPPFDNAYITFDLGFEEELAFPGPGADRYRLTPIGAHTSLNTFVLDGAKQMTLSCQYSPHAFKAAGVRGMLRDITAVAQLLVSGRAISVHDALASLRGAHGRPM